MVIRFFRLVEVALCRLLLRLDSLIPEVLPISVRLFLVTQVARVIRRRLALQDHKEAEEERRPPATRSGR